jgi:hypothetical protein
MSTTNRSGDIGSAIGALLSLVLEGLVALWCYLAVERQRREHPGPFAGQGASIINFELIIAIPFVVMFGMMFGRRIGQAAGKASSSSRPWDEMSTDGDEDAWQDE